MGLSYSCILVRAPLEDAEARVADAMKKMGYLPAAEGEAEVLFYRAPGSAWFDVRCEAFAHAPAMSKFAKLLARRFHGFSLVMEAVDSDFLLLSLINSETNRTTKACIGIPYDDKKPKPDLAAWRLLNPATDFGALFSDGALNAEDGLSRLAEAVGFSQEEVLEPELDEPEPTLSLRFESMDKELLYVQEGLPVLKIDGHSVGPVRMGEFMSVTFMNRYAASKGLDVIVYGPFAEGDEMLFTDPFLTSWDLTGSFSDSDARHRIKPDAVEAVKMENGWRGFQFVFDAFVIPPGLNPGQKKLTGGKLFFAQIRSSFTFSARPHGNAKYGYDIHIAAYPHENRSGAVAWSPMRGKPKEEIIEEQQEFLRRNHERAEKIRRESFLVPAP